MNRLLKIIIIFSAFFISSCLNFNTGSLSFNNNGIDDKYYGTYEGSVTIIENNNLTSQATANVIVSSGSVVTIRIWGSLINLHIPIYKESLIKISDNMYKASVTSSGIRYDLTLSFNSSIMNLYYVSSNNAIGEGNLTKIR
ncbi:hypothetical protein Bint_2906 [Brachyspira intermedia PWS/A]|uniref:Auto-transporter adhesin head GIN domain-containing protein n=1 Tax=Brachyspira intermedia (strain ATCC 51140 / PWS/A) TaxID=1045858 RepID=G0EIE5_BRAIP|nr:hypothetical protein [Brachyspira intermedia]AEM23500.1 hypothetical protein Bint_2906 [Brachyspira intermedia PWS/A]